MATDNIYIQNPDYNPKNIKNPIYILLPKTSSTQNTAAKKFLEMLGVMEMSAKVDIMSDISGRDSVNSDDVILTLMSVIQMYENGEDISGFKDQPIFLGKSFSDDETLYRVSAPKCCFFADTVFFYQNDPTVRYALCQDYYFEIFDDKEKFLLWKVFGALGGKTGPEIFSCSFILRTHYLINWIQTEKDMIHV